MAEEYPGVVAPEDRPAARGDPESRYARLMPDRDCYETWTGNGPLYAPWRDSANLCEDVEDVEILTLNERPRLYYLAALGRHAARLAGAFAECGVFRGGTALLMARVTEETQNQLHLVDSFDGLPEPDAKRDLFYRKGDFRFSDMGTISSLLSESGHRVHVHKGWIPDAFRELPDSDWALVHVDVDLYRPTHDACEYFYERMLPGGVMLFDEYGFPTCRGEREAVDEFFSRCHETPIVLPTGQALVLKL
jgi:O-methyltransferase